MLNGLDIYSVENLYYQLKVGSTVYHRGALMPILEALQDDEHYPEVSDKVSLLIVTLVREHPFEDGNKRMAYSLGAMILLQNGHVGSLPRYSQEMMNIIVHVAQKHIDDELLQELVGSILAGDADWPESLKVRYVLACGNEPETSASTKALYTPHSQFDDLPTDKPIVFISYSWDSPEHKDWVNRLANDLCTKYGIYVLCDCYNRLGEDVVHFMLKGIEKSHRVLMVGTPGYKRKAEQNSGGARYEDHIISVEMYHDMDTLKFIPLLRAGDSFQSAFNPIVETKTGVDFRDDGAYEQNLRVLAADIKGEPLNARPTIRVESGESMVDSQESRVERREQPSLWGKVFQFEKLSNDELMHMVQSACESIRLGRTPSSFYEYVAAVINLCEINDTMIALTEDDWKNIRWNMQQYLMRCEDKETLYERYVNYCQARELLQRKGNGSMIKKIDEYWQKIYTETESKKKDRMTLFLENMTDANIKKIFEVHHWSNPGHRCEYSMIGIFQNVDMEKLYKVICGLNNESRLILVGFIEDRYMLRFAFDGKSGLEYAEEIPSLQQLKKKIDDNINHFELNDKRAMMRLSECIGLAIKRCEGDSGVMLRD